MFTVPHQYQDNQPLEFMLKELSFLFRKLSSYYTGETINLKDLKIRVEKTHGIKWDSYQVNLEPEDFSLFFCSSRDGFIFKECSASLSGINCNENDILNLVEKTNLLDNLREKIKSAKENFINI